MAGERAAFERDGYVVLPEFVPAALCDGLRARMEQMLANFEPAEAATIFSTGARSHAQDRYFLESGDKIRFFFEEEAFDPQGRLKQPKARSINKVGHALHDLDPTFAHFSRQPALAALVAELGIAAPLLLQSMYIFKQPRIGGEVGCHQDAAFLTTEPSSVIGLWFALEDATTANGCLYAAPGGHKGPLRSRFVRHDVGGPNDRTEMITLDATPLPSDGLVPLEVAKGTLVVLHGRLPHGSAPNRSAHSRHAYTLHVIDGDAGQLVAACGPAPARFLIHWLCLHLQYGSFDGADFRPHGTLTTFKREGLRWISTPRPPGPACGGCPSVAITIARRCMRCSTPG